MNLLTFKILTLISSAVSFLWITQVYLALFGSYNDTAISFSIILSPAPIFLLYYFVVDKYVK